MKLAKSPSLFAIGVIQVYRHTLSPLLGPNCRFVPSCSEYAVGALKAHGLWKGSYLASRRLLRCHPFHPGGFDPVPATSRESRCSTR